MAAGTSAVTAERELVISRIIDAPRTLVFKAWTEAEHVARWWGPHGLTITYSKMDIRPGGGFRICMRSPEGKDHWKRGVYREVVAPERLVFTFAWEDEAGNPGHELLTTVTFADHGDGTKLTLHQAMFQTTEACESHRGGWTSTLGRLAEYLATV